MSSMPIPRIVHQHPSPGCRSEILDNPSGGGEEEDDPELRAALQASLEEFKAAKGERREGGG